jgi:hypothetical protein
MANPYLILWIDPALNRLYTGWNQNTPAITPIIKQGDNIGVELHWVSAGNANFPMQEIEFPPSATITLAVGRLDEEPTSGVFVVSYGGDSTGELSFNITATALETELNDLASITAEGGVLVNKTGSVFRIVFNDASVTANTLTADVNNLSPTTNSQVIVARAGTATDRQVLLFSLKQAPIAACVSFTASPAPALTVTSIFTNTWRVSISPTPRTGTFTLSQTVGITTTTTDPIAYNASAPAVQSALNALLTGYFVIKSGEYSWDITVPATVINITADSALVGFSSVYGVLSMNTAEVEEFLAGASSDTATLEVEADISGEIQTLIQNDVTVINDLISTSVFTLVELGEVMPVESVVRYDTAQALTGAEQLQARDNIDSASNADIAALEAEDIVLQGRLDIIEADYVVAADLVPFVEVGEANTFTDNNTFQITSGTVVPLVIINDGTGDCFRVFHATATATPFVVDNAGKTIIGGTAVVGAEHLRVVGNTRLEGLCDVTSFLTVAAPSAADNSTKVPTTAWITNEGFLKSTTAASTYQTIAGMSLYVTAAYATANYITLTYADLNYSPLFDQALNTTDAVSFASLNVASSGFSVGDGVLSTAVGLASTWDIRIQGGGLDTILAWDGLNIGGTTGLTFSALGAKITFPSSNTLDEVDNGGTVTTGGTGTTIKSDDYPEEIFITINGIEYAVPARVV